MPLRGHFQPPLSRQRYWESFYSFWADSIATQLNTILPRRFERRVIVLGAQAGRRGEAEPVRDSPGGQASPAADFTLVHQSDL
jgi:hypothetical protein